eukprot:6179166-Pleurochrysis_carterae.AAC.4
MHDHCVTECKAAFCVERLGRRYPPSSVSMLHLAPVRSPHQTLRDYAGCRHVHSNQLLGRQLCRTHGSMDLHALYARYATCEGGIIERER